MATYMDTLVSKYGEFWEFKELEGDFSKLKVFDKMFNDFKKIIKENDVNIFMSDHFVLRLVQSSLSKEDTQSMLISFVTKYVDKKEAEVEIYPAKDGRFEAKDFYGKWFLVFKDHGNKIDFISAGIPGERKRTAHKNINHDMNNDQKRSYFDNKPKQKQNSRKKHSSNNRRKPKNTGKSNRRTKY